MTLHAFFFSLQIFVISVGEKGKAFHCFDLSLVSKILFYIMLIVKCWRMYFSTASGSSGCFLWLCHTYWDDALLYLTVRGSAAFMSVPKRSLNVMISKCSYMVPLENFVCKLTDFWYKLSLSVPFSCLENVNGLLCRKLEDFLWMLSQREKSWLAYFNETDTVKLVSFIPELIF